MQLREFQYLDEDGIFKIIPEYSEFAWFEGIVNSLTHMYDDVNKQIKDRVNNIIKDSDFV